jgi:hypothetical protein
LRLVGGGAGLVVASLERLRHPVEVVGQRADFVAGVDRAAMAELAGRQHRRILAQSAQWPNDAARQHPGDGERRCQGGADDQRGPAQA